MRSKARARILSCVLMMLVLGLWASTDDFQSDFAVAAVEDGVHVASSKIVGHAPNDRDQPYANALDQ
ncbi:hypothetical protein [Simiduia litorea]|uniref:hypothetical protein n=1 Tax=Simiduia litorea TaxID=1435348 RepID=UPI0036F38587